MYLSSYFFSISALLLISPALSQPLVDLQALPSCHSTFPSPIVQLSPKHDTSNLNPILIFDLDFVTSDSHLTHVIKSSPPLTILLSAQNIHLACRTLVRPLLRNGHTLIPYISPSNLDDFETSLQNTLSNFESCTGYIQPIYASSIPANNTFPLFLIDRIDDLYPNILRNSAALHWLSNSNSPAKPIIQIFDDRQLHCLYDRLDCDLVAPSEPRFESCRQVREEYFSRRRVDLFKFAPKHERDRWNDPDFTLSYSGTSDPYSDPDTSFLDRNRARVDMAFHHIEGSRHSKAAIREILSIMYTLSDGEIEAVSNGSVRMSRLLRKIGADEAAEEDTLYLEPEEWGESFKRWVVFIVAIVMVSYGGFGTAREWSDRYKKGICVRRKVADFSKVL